MQAQFLCSARVLLISNSSAKRQISFQYVNILWRALLLSRSFCVRIVRHITAEKEYVDVKRRVTHCSRINIGKYIDNNFLSVNNIHMHSHYLRTVIFERKKNNCCYLGPTE